MKGIIYLGSSKKVIQSFKESVKNTVLLELTAVQKGFEPGNSKPMSGIGSGVKEIRIKDGAQYRIMYLAKRAEAIYVLHAFIKKTQKTTKRDINLAKKRLQGI